ncbi:MAG: uracil-DNA glycosylase [Campylobacteraceae bacterium]|nr:uracil-DNA glycosylase [Campylobacteraceae bacterium]
MFKVDSSWQDIINKALNNLDDSYLEFLQNNKDYFPNKTNFLNAFKTLSLKDTKYILFGQDPYPRSDSAIGYAFIDGAVSSIWDEKNGLSKEVNKATSLRNFMKMLLICEGKLEATDTSKDAIAKLDRSEYIQSIMQFKDNFEKNGILLLNTALIFTSKDDSKKHVKLWKPFVISLLRQIKEENIKLILFGSLAKDIDKLDVSADFEKFYCEHPYNVSFILNKNVQKLFGQMKLLDKC